MAEYTHDPVQTARDNVGSASTLDLIDSLTRKTGDILALADAISNPMECGLNETVTPNWRHNTLYCLAELIADLATMAHADAVEIGTRHRKKEFVETPEKTA